MFPTPKTERLIPEAFAAGDAPLVIVIMGVSGSGKSCVGQALAERLGGEFADADDFHPAENKTKMAAGHPLTDADRLPWLNALRGRIETRDRAQPLVLACSALREQYRAILAPPGESAVRFVLLDGPKEVITSRLAARKGHFMPPGLLESQLKTLEVPEDALKVSIVQPVESVVSEILLSL